MIRYLHHSVDIQEVKEEISRLGHTVRNVINARHRITKDPLNLLFVDLEPYGNNKDIYKITRLQNSVIQIEPPGQVKHVVQCTRCQLYGHTKSYCSRPYVCVKCSGQHSTASCKKNNNNRPLVLYVEAIIPQITKDVTSIKNNITPRPLPKSRILHKVPQRTALRNPRQSLDPNTKPMHKLYGALNQPLPPPTWTNPRPYLHL